MAIPTEGMTEELTEKFFERMDKQAFQKMYEGDWTGKLMVTGKGRKMGKSYMNEVREISYNMELMARTFKDAIDKSAFSQGYVMDDDSLLPSEQINVREVTDAMVEAIIDDRDYFSIAFTRTVSSTQMIGQERLRGPEEMINFYSCRIMIDKYLYWIDRLAYQVKCERIVAAEKFRQMCIEFWPDPRRQAAKSMIEPAPVYLPGVRSAKSLGEAEIRFKEMRQSASTFSEGVTAAGISVKEVRDAMRALAGSGILGAERGAETRSSLSKDTDSATKSSNSSSAATQSAEKKPESGPKVRAIDL